MTEEQKNNFLTVLERLLEEHLKGEKNGTDVQMP